MQQPGSAIITIDKHGLILTVDKEFCKLFGYSFEELIGSSIQKIIPSPYKEHHEIAFQKNAQQKQAYFHQSGKVIEAQRKDGFIFPVKLSISKVIEGDDIIFIGVIDKIEDKSVHISIDSHGIILNCNNNLEEYFGYKASEVIGKNVNMLMPNPYAERHDSYIQNYLQGGEPRAVGKVRNVAAKHKNGKVFPASIQVEKIQVGNIILFKGKIEKVETLEVAFTIDSDGYIASCNTSFVLPLCGYENQELVGKHISLLFPKNGINGSEADEVVKKRKLENGAQYSNSDPNYWKSTGVRQLLLRHKDGSCFLIDLDIFEFPGDKGNMMYGGRIKRTQGQVEVKEETPINYIGDYQINQTIGQGSHGEVKLGKHSITKQEAAIKILRKSGMSPEDMKRVYREAEILQKMNHPHIAKLYHVLETDLNVYLIMEYAPKTLKDYVLENSGLSETEAKGIFIQILSAIKYFHSMNIIHRDIKQGNLLLDNQNNIKVIDFGVSNFIEEGKFRSTFCGTPAYSAPEMILGKKYIGPEVDIWSLGVVLYSMISAEYPFENVADIIYADFRELKNVSPECNDMVKRLLTKDPTQRIKTHEIEAHPWLTNKIHDARSVECAVVSTIS